MSAAKEQKALLAKYEKKEKSETGTLAKKMAELDAREKAIEEKETTMAKRKMTGGVPTAGANNPQYNPYEYFPYATGRYQYDQSQGHQEQLLQQQYLQQQHLQSGVLLASRAEIEEDKDIFQ